MGKEQGVDRAGRGQIKAEKGMVNSGRYAADILSAFLAPICLPESCISAGGVM